MSTHIETRSKLKEIHRVQSLNELLDSCVLSNEEKQLIRMHYIEDKDFRYIGDFLGYSEITMKRWHKRILRKLNSLL